MKNFIRIHQELFLSGIAVVLLAIFGVVFVWGITDLAVDIAKAIGPQSSKSSTLRFDLEGAKRLNLKGLVQ